MRPLLGGHASRRSVPVRAESPAPSGSRHRHSLPSQPSVRLVDHNGARDRLTHPSGPQVRQAASPESTYLLEVMCTALLSDDAKR